MPTQRPFIANFLTAFRAHSAQLPKASPSISSSAVAASSATIWTTTSAQQLARQPSPASESTIASPKPINPKTNAYNPPPTAATTTAAQDRQFHPSLSPLQHNVSPQTHLPRSPPSPGLPVYGPPNKPQPNYPTCQEAYSRTTPRTRRGSDSSADSNGFREVRGGGEKWFIGGRTPAGEEKYYKLSMVKRDRSSDRISADQLSL